MGRRASARGFDKWFPWISGAVAVAALVVAVVYLSNTSNPQANPEPRQNPLPKAAWRVATKFILAAVARKDFKQAYALSDPSLRAEVSIRDWRSGNLPVVASSVRQIRKTNWEHTNYAHPRDALINVIVVPKNARAWNAQVRLRKFGHGASAHWLVDDFEPLAGPRTTMP